MNYSDSQRIITTNSPDYEKKSLPISTIDKSYEY